jgi:hypothetical protein
MWGLWLAVVLTVDYAHAAPQEVIEEISRDNYVTENTSDTTIRSSLGEEVTALSSKIGLEVIDIVNETKYEVQTTTQKFVVSDSDEQQNDEKEETTAAGLETTEETNIDKTDIVNLDFLNQSTGKDYSEDLYLPDEDPIDNKIDDSLGSDDILDVINNFIAEKDPMLQVRIKS